MKEERLKMQTETDGSTIAVVANGKTYMQPVGSTVADLINFFQINAQRVVVQLDGTIISREAFTQTVLQDGCRLEIVTLVGGG